MSFFTNLGSSKTYIIYVGGFMVFYIIAMIIYMRHKKGKMRNFIEANPNAAKVYVKTKSMLVKSAGLYIHSVDGKSPETLIEGTKTGFYLLPGRHIIESTYTITTPGVLHKSVTTSYGPTNQEVEVEARKTYFYSFDESTQNYIFEETRD